MKVLISDDEHHVIQAIRLLVPWEEFGIDQIYTASNGMEALDIITREAPEIVITDIVMEDKNGIDIMDFIATRHPSIKVIAVSGHNDFEYVRTMLTKGCMDYLLKPLESATLISTVGKAVQCWKDEHESHLRHRHLQEKIHSLSAFYSGVLLYKMLDSRCAETAYQELLQADTSFSSVNTCKIIYCDTSYFPMRNPDFACLLKDFESQVRRSLGAEHGLILSNPEHPGEIMLFLLGAGDLAATSIIKTAQSLFMSTDYPFHLGVSREHPFPGRFSDSYTQAKNAFFCFYGDIASASTAIAALPSMEKLRFYPETEQLHQMEDQIFSSLLIGDRKELEDTAAKWLSQVLPEKEIPLYLIHYVSETFHGLLRQWTSKIRKKNPAFSYMSEDNPLVYEELTDENYLFSRNALRQAIFSSLYRICDELKESRSTSDIMLQIAQYMELNYTKPFIQSEYAKLFYINKDYMSRKFTSTFQVNMLTYLNQIRIRHAKELLSDFSLKIQDIAYAVGFKDEKYFAKQFKKLTNTTPGDYRAALKKEKRQGY
ncbi:MAG: response regulator [Clostridia bacterium]|nr:response regulator [Clostridia bacterium]